MVVENIPSARLGRVSEYLINLIQQATLLNSQGKEMLLWEDVNLDAMTISTDGRTITFQFADMAHGTPIGGLACSDFFYLTTLNIFEDGDGFACYLGEVRAEQVERDQLDKLQSLKNSYLHNLQDKCLFPDEGAIFSVHLESGEIVIDIGCRGLYCPINLRIEASNQMV